MIQLNNCKDNKNMLLTAKLGCFEVYEHQKDLSVAPEYASKAYFMHEMNFRKRQVLCNLTGNAIKMQSGAMQWMAGSVESTSGVKGAGDLLGKFIKSKVSGESAVKPIYAGNGFVMLEPTYKYIILLNVGEWGPQGVVLDDGLFLASDAGLEERIVARTNVSSALLGGEGLFNLCLSGNGVAVLESNVPRDELIEIVLENDEVKIDGNMAIAWSGSLNFTVETSSKSLLGSAINGEGLVNVYRGTGRILMAPTTYGTTMSTTDAPKSSGTSSPSSQGLASSVVKSLLG